jgi:hypothetical protein
MSALGHERTNYARVELLTFEKDMFEYGHHVRA